jgi:hypothetical protein
MNYFKVLRKHVTLYRAVVLAGGVEIFSIIDSARMLYSKFLCSRHFSESDFTTAERVRLNRFAVPCGTDSMWVGRFR